MDASSTEVDAERAAYVELLRGSRQRSVFAQPWWLDAATGSPRGWRPNVLRAADGAARAAWPLPTRRVRQGLVAAGVPYTPFLGPLLPDHDGGVEGISRDVELLEALAGQLAGHAHVEAACMPELDYWTPLAWHGFEQTSRTTWRIDAGGSAASVRAGLRTRGRRALAAGERAGLQVDHGSVADLLRACESTFQVQGRDDVPNAQVLERLATEAVGRGRGEVLAVRTPSGELVSAGLYVHDDRWTWNLANGRVAEAGVNGGPAVLHVHAIERAMERGTGFDFEGSMLRPVEVFVRNFGGRPAAYPVVRRSAPGWARAVAWRRLGKRLLRR